MLEFISIDASNANLTQGPDTQWEISTQASGEGLKQNIRRYFMQYIPFSCSKLGLFIGKILRKRLEHPKTPNVRAHCVAESDANQRRKFFRRPDTNPTQEKNA